APFVGPHHGPVRGRGADRRAGLRRRQLPAEANRRVRQRGARARDGRRGRKRGARASDVPRPGRRASVLMVRTEPRLAIRTVDRIARLEAAAYPVLQADTPDGFARFAERVRALAAETGTRVAIAELDGEAVGAMATYEFTMRLRERDARAAGLGSVAVSLAHKRRGIARAMVRRFLDDAHEQGASIALLHPFRLDFYRTLGFGYGTPTQRYRLAPATIDVRGARGTARILGARDLEAMLACDERVRATTNGLLARSPARLARLLAEPGLRYVGVDDDGTLRAFMQTSVRLGPEGSTNA